METFVSEKTGRTFILKLVQGEDLLESIEKLIRENGIENAVVLSGIATFDRLRIHMITTTGYPVGKHMEERDDVPLELVSLQGLIVEGQPHLHCTVSNKDSAYAGHLHYGCRILYLGEVVIQELLGLNIYRHKTELGVNHIFSK